jgi:hypothetical protein
VLLLPQFGELDFYNQYDFAVAWDHPKNLNLAKSNPHIAKRYQWEDDRAHDGQVAHFFALVGSDTLWPGPHAVKSDVLERNLDRAAIVVQRKRSVHWMNPSDIMVRDSGDYDTDGGQVHFMTASGRISLFVGDGMIHQHVNDFTLDILKVRKAGD